MKEKVIENSQHRFTKAKPSLTNLFLFYDKTTRFVDMRRAVNIVYLDIGKVSHCVPQYLCIRVRMLHSKWMDN